MVAVNRLPVALRPHTLKVHPSAARRKTVRAPRIRQSLTPGTVVILLAGPYAGRRVILLKALEDGRLAVTGPYGVNRVPMGIVEQKKVIATSTKVELTAVDTSQITAALFKKVAVKKDEMSDKKCNAKKTYSPEVRAIQDTIEQPLIAAVKKVDLMERYLKTRFSLTSTFGVKPHDLKF